MKLKKTDHVQLFLIIGNNIRECVFNVENI